MDAVIGTVVGRWYVTLFGLVVPVAGLAPPRLAQHRHLRRRRARRRRARRERLGAPRHPVHPLLVQREPARRRALRRRRAADGAAQLHVHGVLRVRGRSPARQRPVPHPGAARVARAARSPGCSRVWAIWILDPVSRLGDQFYLGELLALRGPRLLVRPPARLASSASPLTAGDPAASCSTASTATRPTSRVPGGLRDHPHLVALITYHAQVFHLAAVAFYLGADTIGGAAILIWVPAAVITAVHWSQLAIRAPRVGRRRQRRRRPPLTAGPSAGDRGKGATRRSEVLGAVQACSRSPATIVRWPPARCTCARFGSSRPCAQLGTCAVHRRGA